ncbi:hypothetical protein OWV82_012404 [Melia azedarach]|uniref:Uncharacterized protein n=1 Tax=Melia azedarach TaxID=155640 RepID=A0ACC1Y1R6_MELAZ|nr:hypothetical protein OWV82_012404 [Melia azedarach]
MQSCNCNCCLQNPSSEQHLISSSTSYPNIFGFLIPALIGIVSANVQGAAEPLFATHKMHIWSFLLATAAYCGALAADVKSRHRRASSSQFWRLVAVILGSLSSVSLVSTFAERSVGNIILFTAWTCAGTIIVIYKYGKSFLGALRWLCYDILKPFFSTVFNLFQGDNMDTQLQLPPV